MVTPVKFRRTAHAHLRNHLTVRPAYLSVITVNDMKYHRIISLVAVVTMAMPVARPHMDFDITRPQVLTYFHLCIEKVRPRIGV